MKSKCTLEMIREVGEDGMYEASLNIDDHSECITVIGTDLEECVNRTRVVIQAFNSWDNDKKE